MPTAKNRPVRERLGIPDDAERVLIVSESSHWDPNWLFTADEYYSGRVRDILDRVVGALRRDPERVFGLECLFFLQKYWEDRPNVRDSLRALADRGQLRMLGGGLTTPDSNLPHPEALVRDYLLGQRWLDDRGLSYDPELAYFPDSFGHSPALPSLLDALGFTQTVITRIDGMYFPGTDFRSAGDYPTPNSTAKRLLDSHRTNDFIWRGPDGAEIVCHWNAHTYFQGDMLGARGAVRWMDILFGWEDRSTEHVADQLERESRRLAKLSRTRYLLCPVGFDFNGPIRGLPKLLRRYNRERYPETGLYVVNGGMDDYMDLIETHREKLPTVEVDPNPYWSGFYASRTEVKEMTEQLVGGLLAEESERANPDVTAGDSNLDEGWWVAAVANHHDFITGTSPDRVWEGEQRPWLKRALSERMHLTRRWNRRKEASDATGGTSPFVVDRSEGRLEVRSERVRAVFDERTVGTIQSLEVDGRTFLDRGSGRALAYRDSGGLWRFGYEFRGGRWDLADEAVDGTSLGVERRGDELEVRSQTQLAGEPVSRTAILRSDTPSLRLRFRLRTPRRHTSICRCQARMLEEEFEMAAPGGIRRRETERGDGPEFWPLRSVARLDRDGSGAIGVLTPHPTALRVRTDGTFEWVLGRNAPHERAWRIVPVPAHPARGTDDRVHEFEVGLSFHPEDCPDFGTLFRLRNRFFRRPQIRRDWFDLEPSNAADVVAVKPAMRGPGVIVRLRATQGAESVRIGMSFPLGEARRCDARETDLEELPTRDVSTVDVPLDRNLVTVRLVPAPDVADSTR